VHPDDLFLLESYRLWDALHDAGGPAASEKYVSRLANFNDDQLQAMAFFTSAAMVEIHIIALRYLDIVA
jgi:hypothetical protein